VINLYDIPLALSYDDVLLVPQYSRINSRSEIILKTKISPRVSIDIPLISSNMSDVTDANMAVAIASMGGLGVIPRFQSIEEQANQVKEVKSKGLLVGAAVGARSETMEHAEILVKAGADILFLDVAHGHMLKNLEATTNLKRNFGEEIDLVSGNSATFEAADALFKAGADCVKVGIGPGSICTTRIMTGSGVPQITAIAESARAARKHKKYIIADGGVKTSGDVVKGLAAGASAIMAGNIFAGCDEAPGKIITKDGKKFKIYNGSTSPTEKKKQSNDNHIEGVESMIPYKGPLSKIIDSYMASIRSGFSYSGALDIETLWKNAKFIRITSQGLRESNAHDVILL
jgi:IMP dehydrogenase